jgi:hypothetical protein
MKIIDVYTPFLETLARTQSLHAALKATQQLSPFAKRADDWGIVWSEVEAWMLSPAYESHALRSASPYLRQVTEIVRQVEASLGVGSLPGELHLIPSCQAFDGFARYELGHHRVLLGIDFPDADLSYLQALTAHELSHVYRDHQPEVWSRLGKPLSQITRQEYLDAGSAREHLVSEGLATLFSQLLFPSIPAATHHYYERPEYEWCTLNRDLIDAALRTCLSDPSDENVWRFYGEDEVAAGSPSRTHYFWAAERLREFLDEPDLEALIEAHRWSADRFTCFHSSSG